MSDLLRKARAGDCKAGAVLVRDGEFWDVLEDWKSGACVRMRSDSGQLEHVQAHKIDRFRLVRHAPVLNEVPVLDQDREERRRARLDFKWLENA